MDYELTLPQRIVFGCGRRRELATYAGQLGNRAIVVCGSKTLEQNGDMDSIRDSLEKLNINVLHTAEISNEPTVHDVDYYTEGYRFFREKDGVLIIAIGGGSAIDLGKSLAGMIPQTETDTIADYLEGVGRGLILQNDPLPLIAIPTTAGTGSEATKNAVIAGKTEDDIPYKKSIRDNRLMPRIVLIDPELMVSCPAKITAQSGMDAITQLFESYVSRKTQPFTQSLCEQGLSLALDSIVEAVEHPESLPARESMAHAAMLSGITLANAGLGMAHGIAPALGSICDIPHGLACATLLPQTLRVNAEVCDIPYKRLANLLVGSDSIEKMIQKVESICRRIGIPAKLGEIGVKAELIPKIAENSQGSSMKGNPKTLTQQEIVEILTALM